MRVQFPLFLLILTNISCRPIVFSENVRQQPNQHFTETSEPISLEKTMIDVSDEDYIEVKSVKDNQQSDEVVIPDDKISAEAHFQISLVQMKHDSLYKNCLYAKVNGEDLLKVRCNKNYTALKNISIVFGDLQCNVNQGS